MSVKTSELKILYRDFLRIRNISGRDHLETHLHAAVDWLLRAQSAAGDGGIAASFKLIPGKWTPSYPETTGYTIPILLDYANRYGREDIKDRVKKMVEYELSVQMPDGGFPCFPQKPGAEARPVAFDTGQILFGLIAAYEQTQYEQIISSAVRAANWLVKHQNQDGSWEDYQSVGSLKAIDTRVSWALLCLHKLTQNSSYQASARRQLEWAIQQQQPNGWFQCCSFDLNQPPVTHTIAYVIEGLLESGLVLNNDLYTTAARKAADQLLGQLSPVGYLPGAFDNTWHRSGNWSCLTGAAQMARIWLRIFDETGVVKYYQAAERAILFICSTQYLNGVPAEIRGAVAGSWPVFGGYMRLKYPNWASAFFVDAILRFASQPDNNPSTSN